MKQFVGKIAAGFSMAALWVAAPAVDRPPAKPFGRPEAVAIIAEARRIVTPNGVERLEKVRIGGIDQFVSLFEGRMDRNVNAEVAAEWFDSRLPRGPAMLRHSDPQQTGDRRSE